TELPVITILASGITIDFTADGLTIQGGKNFPTVPATPCHEGKGGGVCAQVSAAGSLSLALSRVVLQRNLANNAGGGRHAKGLDSGSTLDVTVTDSTVTKNGAPNGGGIQIDGDFNAAVSLTLDRLVVKKNRGGQVPGTAGFGIGGGLVVTSRASRNATLLL